MLKYDPIHTILWRGGRAMAFLGMELPAWTRPALDPGFVPLSALFAHYAQGAAQPLAVAVEREDSQVSVYETAVFGTPDYARADRYYVERLVKLLLWIRGASGSASAGTPRWAARWRRPTSPAAPGTSTGGSWSGSTSGLLRCACCPTRRGPLRRRAPAPSPAGWKAAVWAWTWGPAGARCAPCGTAWWSTAARPPGSPRPTRTPITTTRPWWPPCGTRRPTCPGWTASASPPPGCWWGASAWWPASSWP